MARKLELKIAVWLVAALLLVAGSVLVYFGDGGLSGLGRAGQLTLGLILGGMAFLVYVFSARKWLLILLYRYQIFRPAERAQNAVELARSDLADLQLQIDQERVKSQGDMRKKALEILKRYNIDRALQPVVLPRDGQAPKVDFERRQSFGKLEHWLYVHAAMGIGAIVVVLLHADFSLGGLVSGALLLTFLGACVTGLYGGWLYWVMPSRLAEAEVKLGFDDTRLQMERIDHEIAEVGEKKPDLKAILERQRKRLEEYYAPQVKRKLKLEAWLWIHIPLAVAALVLLVFHVASVWYW